MKNKIPFIITITLCIVLFSYIVFTNLFQKKIVYVDSMKLIENYKGMTVARNEYKKKADLWQANIDSLVRDIQNEITALEKIKITSNNSAKLAQERLIKTKQSKLEQYQKALSETARNEDNRMTTEVIKEINRVISEYGSTHDYDFILVATQSGNIAYAKEGLDITSDIQIELNRNYIAPVK